MKGLLMRLLGWAFNALGIWKSDDMDVSPRCKQCGHSFDDHYALDSKTYHDGQARQPCHHISGFYKNDCTCADYVPAL